MPERALPLSWYERLRPGSDAGVGRVVSAREVCGVQCAEALRLEEGEKRRRNGASSDLKQPPSLSHSPLTSNTILAPLAFVRILEIKRGRRRAAESAPPGTRPRASLPAEARERSKPLQSGPSQAPRCARHACSGGWWVWRIRCGRRHPRWRRRIGPRRRGTPGQSRTVARGRARQPPPRAIDGPAGEVGEKQKVGRRGVSRRRRRRIQRRSLGRKGRTGPKSALSSS